MHRGGLSDMRLRNRIRRSHRRMIRDEGFNDCDKAISDMGTRYMGFAINRCDICRDMDIMGRCNKGLRYQYKLLEAGVNPTVDR